MKKTIGIIYHEGTGTTLDFNEEEKVLSFDDELGNLHYELPVTLSGTGVEINPDAFFLKDLKTITTACVGIGLFKEGLLIIENPEADSYTLTLKNTVTGSVLYTQNVTSETYDLDSEADDSDN